MIVDDYTFYWRNLILRVTPNLKRADLDPKLALALAVKKWQFISQGNDLAEAQTGGVATCGLCRLFWIGGGCHCGCIIKQITRQSFCCLGTPYTRFINAKNDNEAKLYAEAEHRFLLALQSGGSEAGRRWLDQWMGSVAHDASVDTPA